LLHIAREEDMSQNVSIVIPLYNEEENVDALTAALSGVMDRIGVEIETIIVDDGSTDRSWEKLKAAHARDPRFRMFRLGRNFGQTPAMTAGFAHAKGDIIVTLDADLQNDPEDIPRLLNKMKDGYDIVSGWRKNRQDTLSRRLSSRLANRLIGAVSGAKLHDTGCTLKAYKSEIGRASCRERG